MVLIEEIVDRKHRSLSGPDPDFRLGDCIEMTGFIEELFNDN